MKRALSTLELLLALSTTQTVALCFLSEAAAMVLFWE